MDKNKRRSVTTNVVTDGLPMEFVGVSQCPLRHKIFSMTLCKIQLLIIWDCFLLYSMKGVLCRNLAYLISGFQS